MSGRFETPDIDGYWTAIKNATLGSPSLSAETVVNGAQLGGVMQAADQVPPATSASALLHTLTGLRAQQPAGRSFPTEAFDSAVQTAGRLPQSVGQLLPGDQTLQQQQLPNFQYSPRGGGKPASTDFKATGMPAAILPVQQPGNSSGSNEDDKAQALLGNGDRKSQLKEKNRKAQKRFRERQKTKLAESEDKVALMSQQIEQLQAERATLMDRNSILEQVLSAQQTKEREERSQSAGGAASFETDAATQQDLALRHNLQQGLVLTVRPQHIMLSLEQIRNLPWEETVAIWQDYVNALAACLVQTEGNANSPARERIKQLVQECFCLSAATAMVNPTGSLVFYSLKMDAQSPDGAAEKPNAEYWAHIAQELHATPQQGADLKLPRREFLSQIDRNIADWLSELQRELHATPEQRADLKLARREFLSQIARNISERQQLLQMLQDSMPPGSDYPMTATKFFQSLEAHNKLRHNMQQQHSCLVQFASGICQRLNDPFQGATLIVQSFPWSPDVLSIINAMAEQDGEPRTEALLTSQTFASEGEKAKAAAHS